MGSGGERESPRRGSRCWEMTGAAEDWRPPETEQECLEYYQERMTRCHLQQLLPLQEDLADWINNTLGLDHVNASNLFDVLENGVILCHLAKVIQTKAQEALELGIVNRPIPEIKGPFFEKASRRSFFSRDNLDKFIRFSKQLGVHSNLLFETNDLVQKNQPRNVVLCLMEVARIASRFNLDPPGLIVLEKEIAEEESRDLAQWKFESRGEQAGSCDNVTLGKRTDAKSLYMLDGGCGVGEVVAHPKERVYPASGGTSEDGGEAADLTELNWSSSVEENIQEEVERGLDHLDYKVKHAAKAAQRQCQCSEAKCGKLKVKKVGEGKYNIFGRNVFVRLLKGKHMMVRVGGGWDTLEHFLQRHDPCQSRTLSRPSTPAGGKTRPYSAAHAYGVLNQNAHSFTR